MESLRQEDALIQFVDRYAIDTKKSSTHFSLENTILGNMAKSEISFVLWIYSTVLLRDGTMGLFDTEEVRWWYGRSLVALQKKIASEAEQGVSDHLINALACIQATSVRYSTADSESYTYTIELLLLTAEVELCGHVRCCTSASQCHYQNPQP